jgi:hypothetical protein
MEEVERSKDEENPQEVVNNEKRCDELESSSGKRNQEPYRIQMPTCRVPGSKEDPRVC